LLISIQVQIDTTDSHRRITVDLYTYTTTASTIKNIPRLSQTAANHQTFLFYSFTLYF